MADQNSQVCLSRGGTQARISVHGAELQSLVGADGHEYLWHAGIAWPHHAPVLFPAIGRHPGDLLRVGAEEFPLGHHGFARDLAFGLSERGPGHATFTLRHSDATLRQFPFAFLLTITYRLLHTGVEATFRVRNPGSRAMPFGIGLHPAFKWPLDDGVPKEEHVLVFDQPETAHIRLVRENLLQPKSMVADHLPAGVMKLLPQRFDHGAVVFDKLQSTSAEYRSPTGRSVRMSWTGFRELGVWSPVEGELVCIEPWRGLPAPHDWADDERNRPDLEQLGPGLERTYTLRIDLVPQAS